MRRLLQAVGFIVGALVAVIGVELVMLSRREYLPSDPDPARFASEFAAQRKF